MTNNTEALPPLPEERVFTRKMNHAGDYVPEHTGYTDDDLRDYALAALSAQAAELAGLREDATYAAFVAFGLIADYDSALLPADAQVLAEQVHTILAPQINDDAVVISAIARLLREAIAARTALKKDGTC